jgi:CRP-like cAMP-binding protein
LLAALPRRDLDRLLPHLEWVTLHFRAVLHESHQPLRYAYFPAGAVLSLLSPGDDNDGVEVGLVGPEGMAGLALFFEASSAPFRCVVQVPGEAYRLPAAAFRRRVRRDGALHGLLLRYAHAFLAQASQCAACNALHALEQRLCRWLLAVHGRVRVDRFPLTHEFLAAMLGVRRATVTEAARALRERGLIRYGRGHLTVLDRQGLADGACGCHAVVQREFANLPGPK